MVLWLRAQWPVWVFRGFCRGCQRNEVVVSWDRWWAFRSYSIHVFTAVLTYNAFVLYLRHKCGFKCASFDFTYSQNESRPGSMDFLRFSGFLFLAQQMASDHIYVVCMITPWAKSRDIAEVVYFRHHAGTSKCNECTCTWLRQLGYTMPGNFKAIMDQLWRSSTISLRKSGKHDGQPVFQMHFSKFKIIYVH